METISSVLLSSLFGMLVGVKQPAILAQNSSASSAENLNFRIDQVLVVDNSAFGNAAQLQFDLYLERPDIKLKEPRQFKYGKFKYTVDLPTKIQPKYMYVSELSDRDHESGNMCDRPRFPHRCEMDITAPKPGETPIYNYLIKVTFEDGTYAEKEINVPYVGFPTKPEIIAPTDAPAQNSTFEIKFKDTGAKEYRVDVDLCKPYGNDGINPCLDGTTYFLKRSGKNLKLRNQEGAENADINVKDGIVTLTSSFKLQYQTAIDYTVQATTSTRPTKQLKVKSYLESNDFKTFKAQ